LGEFLGRVLSAPHLRPLLHLLRPLAAPLLTRCLSRFAAQIVLGPRAADGRLPSGLSWQLLVLWPGPKPKLGQDAARPSRPWRVVWPSLTGGLPRDLLMRLFRRAVNFVAASTYSFDGGLNVNFLRKDSHRFFSISAFFLLTAR
jgi:hypothetical protein